jgi:hypothetical protein
VGLQTSTFPAGSQTWPMAQRVKWQMVWTAAVRTWWLESASPISLNMHSRKRRSCSERFMSVRSRTSDRSSCPPDQLAGQDPDPAALDLAAVQPLGQHLAHGGAGQLLVGRVGQRGQAAAAQPPGRAHPEQLLEGPLATMIRPPRSSRHAGAAASSTSASDRSTPAVPLRQRRVDWRPFVPIPHPPQSGVSATCTLDIRIGHYRASL